MTETLVNDVRVLEYWRKRYLAQALIVGVVAVSAVLAAFWCADFWISRLFICLLAGVIFYVMVKALKNSLQARGEGLILAKGEAVFGEVMFDVGRGLCENALLAQEVVPSYQVRECDNVMRGKGYWLEEDWFYSVLSSRYVPINQTMFQGVVLAFADVKSEDGLKGDIVLKNGKAVVTGGLSRRLKETGAVETATYFMQMFKADGAALCVAEKTLYIWIKSEEKLFYQFNLLQPNTLTKFQNRIYRLKELSEQMLRELNG